MYLTSVCLVLSYSLSKQCNQPPHFSFPLEHCWSREKERKSEKNDEEEVASSRLHRLDGSCCFFTVKNNVHGRRLRLHRPPCEVFNLVLIIGSLPLSLILPASSLLSRDSSGLIREYHCAPLAVPSSLPSLSQLISISPSPLPLPPPHHLSNSTTTLTKDEIETRRSTYDCQLSLTQLAPPPDPSSLLSPQTGLPSPRDSLHRDSGRVQAQR
jgi:hypothetical protein